MNLENVTEQPEITVQSVDPIPLGAEVVESGVDYRIWAPAVKTAKVEILNGSGIFEHSPPAKSLTEEPELEVLRTIPLEKDEWGFFTGCDESGKVGDFYKFCLDGKESYPDPISRFQPLGVHGPSVVVDGKAFAWTDQNWVRPRMRDMVIYELHIGTFTQRGTFLAARERLAHVKDLGATAIEIMPVAEFAGVRNWGYDGVYLYAPEHAYGTPDDFRSLVDAAHSLGLAVILDVVYNHFGPDGNYLAEHIGEYLDEEAKTPWGGAIRYWSPEFQPLRQMVAANPVYWMKEFHVDGFRLDATHAIVDEPTRHILQDITSSVHALGGFAIAEDPRNEARVIESGVTGELGFDGVWADDFHHTVRVANTGEREAYYADFTGSRSELADTLQNGWLFRGQFSEVHGADRGTACEQVQPKRFIHCISNHDQTGNHAFGERLSRHISAEAYRAASALLCLSPYTPMLFMGQEWAATTPFQFFTDHNEELGKLITEGRREEFKQFKAFQNPETRSRIPDPQSEKTFLDSKLNWQEIENETSRQTLALYKTCLGLRNSDRAFRPESREGWQVEELEFGALALRLRGENGDWLAIFDLVGGPTGSLKNESICALPPGCKWSRVFSSNAQEFGGTGNCAIDLETQEARFEVPEFVLLRES